MRRFLILTLSVLVASIVAACTQAGITDTPTPSLTPLATPTSLPMSPTAIEILSMSRDRMEAIDTLHMEITQRVQRGDVTILPYKLTADVERPESVHGVVEFADMSQEFLSVGDDEYTADSYRQTFRLGRYSGSDQPWSSLVEQVYSLVGTLADGNSSDGLQRQPDKIVEGRTFYSLTFSGNMSEFLSGDGILGDLEDLGSVEVRSRGELLIDQDSLLLHQLTLSCEDCYLPFMFFGASWAVSVEAILSEFDLEMDIPSPQDDPTLLPEMTPTPTAQAPPTASPMLATPTPAPAVSRPAATTAPMPPATATVAPAVMAVPDIGFSLYQGEDMLGSTEVRLWDLIGDGKPVVLNFWAGLLPPSRAELPGLQELHEQYGDMIQVIGLDVGSLMGLGTSEDAVSLLNELSITFPAGFTEDEAVISDYELVGLPTTYFISPRGEVFREWTGLIDYDMAVRIMMEMFHSI